MGAQVQDICTTARRKVSDVFSRILLAGASQVNLCLGLLSFIPNAAEQVQLGYKKLGKTKEAVFPLSFESTLNVNGRPLKMVIPGFMAQGLDGQTCGH